MKKIRILSLDGGGIRGILPATLLNFIEEELRKREGPEVRLSDYFDLFAGTSTGGILSILYNIPNEKKRPKVSTETALKLYQEEGYKIFDLDLFKRLTSIVGLIDEKYDATSLVQLMQDYCGDLMLNDLLKPCMITAYDFRNRNAKFFTSYNADDKVKNFRLRDVARATSAAPTYFEPVRVHSELGTPYSLVDGGVFANNPSLCAYSEARKMKFSKILCDDQKPDHPTAKDMMIVSISTGTETKKYKYHQMRNRGVVNWVKPLIDILMSGNAETVNYQLRQIWDTLDGDHKNDYYRLNPSLHNANAEMDDASFENTTNLHEAGLVFIDKYQSLLEEIVDKLIANK